MPTLGWAELLAIVVIVAIQLAVLGSVVYVAVRLALRHHDRRR
jgi:hypothetical protein